MLKILVLIGVIHQFIILDLLITIIYLVNRRWGEKLGEFLFYPFASFYLSISIATLKISLRTHHEEPDAKSPLIIIANHQSLLDIFALIWAFPQYSLRFIGKIQLQSFFPLVSTMLRIQQHVLIDRNTTRRETSKLIEKNIQRLLRKSPENRAVVVYPEGTRSRDGKVLPFRTGAVRTIIKENPRLPILPVALEGGYRVATLAGLTLAKRCFNYYLHSFPLQHPENGEWGREELIEVIASSQKMIEEQIDRYRNKS